jgi:quinol monooxygenase YgiN
MRKRLPGRPTLALALAMLITASSTGEASEGRGAVAVRRAGAPARASEACCPVLELRQYTRHPGKRDALIALFDRELVESQEALGMRIVGQFRDSEDPDRFVWLRGFRDMGSRAEASRAFYGGPVWKAHREEANATMVDSSDVLLLRPVDGRSAFPPPPSVRPPVGARERPASLVVATIYSRAAPVDDAFIRFFERQVRPVMTATGAQPLAWFQSEPAENTFPALPVRTGENVFVWFSSFASQEQYRDHLVRLARSKRWNEQVLPGLLARLKAPPRQLRLEPTARSQLR